MIPYKINFEANPILGTVAGGENQKWRFFHILCPFLDESLENKWDEATIADGKISQGDKARLK